MSGTIITKKTIAKSFKDLMATTPIQQITVRQIMDHAHIRRQTFYDHFQDKYELTTWIYQQDFKEYIQDYIGYDPLNKVLERFLHYLKENKVFYSNALSYHDQNAFEEVLLDQLFIFSQQIIEIQLAETNRKKSVQEYQTLSKFIAYALTGVIRDWINSDCKQEINELLNEINYVLDHMIL